ncbi:favin [Ricinus communis]|uniref:favin n=1 Tax=Ricinus communis TaxID=3988 RepID=UPI00201AFE45|nr:favin [Ricinus communis]
MSKQKELLSTSLNPPKLCPISCSKETSRAIKLTKSFDDLNSNGSVGRATYFKLIHLWDKDFGNVSDFTTYFSFAINSKGNESRGNGFAFFLANNGSKVQALSKNGCLGLSNATDVHPFVTVEFDTGYSPKWDPSD